MIGKIQCWWYGRHQRGKLVEKSSETGLALYLCRRCKATWSRKVKTA